MPAPLGVLQPSASAMTRADKGSVTVTKLLLRSTWLVDRVSAMDEPTT